MGSWIVAAAVAGALAAAPLGAPGAVPPETQADIEAVADAFAAGPVCEHLGYTVTMTAGALRIGEIVSAAKARGISEDSIDDAGKAATGDAVAVTDRAIDALWRIPDQASLRPKLVEMADAYAARCARAAADPELGALVTAPAGYDAATARTAFVERMMVPANLGALQPTRVAAMANLLRSLGQCKARLDPAHVERALSRLTREDRGAEGVYLKNAFEAGVKEGARTPASAQTCARMAEAIRPMGAE